MATDTGLRLGIDFGTSHTTAVLRWPDGHVRPLLFDASPLLPSAIYLEPDGNLLVGRDAIHAARLDPARFEPTPKRCIDRETLRLGDQEVAVTAVIAAVLGRVKDEAVRVSGTQTHDLTLTHPAGWDSARADKLKRASHEAGLPEPRMIPEPVAAAGYFVAVLGRAIPAGSALVVYDFGGGTFDASVVVPALEGMGGYDVLAVNGLDDVGGVDLDAALLRHVAREHHDADPDAWRRLSEPQTPADRRHRRHLIEDVRAAKEMLSRAASATVPVPLLELEVRITREQFDALARPLLDRTVDTTNDVIRSANLPKERVAAILLVGGSSRIPLVADLLRDRAGLTPSTIDQPEIVVAEGSVRLASGGTGTTSPGRRMKPVPGRQLEPVPDAPVQNAGSRLSQPVDPWRTSEQPTPVLNLDTPTPGIVVSAPSAVATVFASAPVKPPSPRVPYQDRTPPTPYRSGRRKKRRWLAMVLVAISVAAAATTVVLVNPDLLDRFIATPAPSKSTPAPTKPPYVRAVTPTWLPQGWSTIVDDELRRSVVPGEASNGGTCTYVSEGVLHVVRDKSDVSGCNTTESVRQFVVRDGAIEAEFRVDKGCGGMWLRTGARGYFVAVCVDGTVSGGTVSGGTVSGGTVSGGTVSGGTVLSGTVALHELADDPPSATTLVRPAWTPPFNPRKVVVGLLAIGAELTVYVDGEAQEIIFDDSIGSGRVGVGGFAPNNAADATIRQFRAWTPTGAGG